METLVCLEPGRFTYEQREKPVLKPGHAIIKIRRIGVCGTDLHAFDGTQPFFSYPRILGHELSGELIEFNNAPGFYSGEKVTFIPYFNCGHCIACRNSKSNCCMHMKVCSVHVDDGMAEYLMIASDKLLNGQGLDFDELALIELLAVASHGISRADVKKDEFVLVMGAGPIGLGAIAFAQLRGARVIVLDVNDSWLSFCKNQLNVRYTINGLSENVAEALSEITAGDMPYVVIDATGSLTAINKAFLYMAHGGRYELIGLQKSDISFNHPEFHNGKELNEQQKCHTC